MKDIKVALHNIFHVITGQAKNLKNNSIIYLKLKEIKKIKIKINKINRNL